MASVIPLQICCAEVILAESSIVNGRCFAMSDGALEPAVFGPFYLPNIRPSFA